MSKGSFPYTPKKIIRKGESEFTGTVVESTQHTATDPFLGQRTVGYGFRVRRNDDFGNLIEVIEVFFPSTIPVTVHPNDELWIKGKWSKQGRIKVLEAKNLTTNVVLGKKKSKSIWGLVFGGIGIIMTIFFMLMFFALLIGFMRGY